MMCHSASETPERVMLIPEPGVGSNGFIGKAIKYVGKEAHAGGAPHQGVNALNAAMLGLMGIHANRETFKDADAIRVHPIITKGGDLVNIVPADVTIETYVRGRSIDAIMDASQKVNRALEAGAMAVGAEVIIDEIPGYLPLFNDEKMTKLFAENCAELLGDEGVKVGKPMGGSTDMGDITHIMPGIHPQVGGVAGRAHARDYMIVDPDMAYVVPAKAMAMTVIDLLFDDAALGRQIKEEFKPIMTKEEYLAMWDELIQGK
jgi:metal-dependent amidase/aminoacylase/carboxypeptidase family protein